MTDEHLRKKDFVRQGYFEKCDRKTYRKNCIGGGRGYLGYWHEAHHILPATSMSQSVEEAQGNDLKKIKYIDFIQYVTIWDINDASNMVGLPNLIAYELYYQNKINLKRTYDRVKGMFDHFKKRFSLTAKQRALEKVRKNNPDGWPIHNPGNWGHLAYNDEVMTEIKTNIWDILSYKWKEHKVDSDTVKEELETWSEINFDYLQERGADASLELWERRFDLDDDGWYTPYTMYDVENPMTCE